MKHLFNKGFFREMLPLAIPIALQNLLMASFRLVDMLMLGQLSGDALAAVDLASQISFFVDLLSFGVSSGCAVFLAQYHGAKNTDGIHRVMGVALVTLVPAGILATLLSVLFPHAIMQMLTNDESLRSIGVSYLSVAAFSYIAIVVNSILSTVLRSTEKVHLPLIASGTAAALNALLNYALIFGHFGLPALGARGAGIATAISAATGPVILLIVSILKRNVLIAPLKKIFDIKRFFLPFWKRSLPAFLNETLWSLSIVIVNMIFGHMGKENYAGLSTVRTIENLVFVFFIGICHSCNIIVGKHIGAGDESGARRIANSFLILTPLAGFVLGMIVLVLRGPVVDLFQIGDSSKAVARALLLMYAFEIGFRNIPYIEVVGIFRAGGDTRIGFFGDLAVQYLVVIPIAAILGLWVKLPFVTTFVIMQICDDIAKNLIYFFYYRKGNWIKPVSHIRFD
ncbi:MAG: MATE family efflux transporter [Clostridia bacterium]|nr:MATE family efflux transporter [Clostridia bacterium]